ncbi:hypothetical protein [Roseibium sediminicola]|uniref:Uncharacterized protein n=1 Tax=Roseibium sediminicola TaxID=2933272 RepID=A0ABT0H0A2_9HYPH|nr:hypothetical protein [Roseibium sp. CAU 1639]MCK7615111.1 hypothetical protein [Roseibium sp. CAU 1639]
MAAIFFLWLAFVYFHKLAKLVMGDLSYMVEVSGHKVPWTILLLLPLYFLFDKADVLFKRFGDFRR